MDKACIDECPVDAIYQGRSMSYIHPEICVDCGACEAVCPVEAIYYEDDVPAEWGRFVLAAEDFATRVPENGGAGIKYPFDSPLISSSEPEPVADATEPPGPSEVAAALAPFQGLRAGACSAVVWNPFEPDLHAVKALLIPFERVILIGSSRPHRDDRWHGLVDAGLVARVAISDLLALLGRDTVGGFLAPFMDDSRSSRSAVRPDRWKTGLVMDIFQYAVRQRDKLPAVWSWDGETLDAVVSGVVQMLQQALATRDIDARAAALPEVRYGASTRALAAGFVSVLATLAPPGSATVLPCEWTLPSCRDASVAQLLEFRQQFGAAYREYIDVLAQTLDSSDPGWQQTPDAVADAAMALRRLSRRPEWAGRGYLGLGLVGSASGATAVGGRRMFTYVIQPAAKTLI
jgi:ferredoxin